MPDPNPNLMTVFGEALERADPAARANYLDLACEGDEALRRRVEALLAAHAGAGRFLEPESANDPATGAFTADPPTQGIPSPHGAADTGTISQGDRTSTFVSRPNSGVVVGGRYTLREMIGEGGMGEVWVASQAEPVKRKVALKLIKPGMDSKSVLARFEQERQALAIMDHPNIARVIDGGMTATGQPYFVMELVNGLPLTKFCDEAKLSFRERLELFVPICQAVQHAHQKGIVHRDLKPANILVTMIDGRPVPKVIDFGVAKATAGKLTDESLSTQFGAVVGTLEYMSPEQAGYSGDDIDTRSDIYSLGVILYELLTGLRPIDVTRLKQAAITEWIRIIREEEPSKPSTRLSANDSLASTAALRQVEPGRLMAMLRGELDWVVMKCLEKSRERRYETASGLARDVQRYLANEMVEARPPSVGYRARKFLTRNKGPVVAAGVVLLALVAGFAGTMLGLVEARRQRDVAERAKEDAIESAATTERARVEEAAQRRNAETANRQAVEALKSFTDDLMGKVLGNRDKLTETETAILRNAQKQWEAFARYHGDTPEARVIRAEGAAELALVQYKLGMNAEAEANDRAALALRTGLANDFPDVPLYRLKQGMSHQNLGASLRGNASRAEAEANFARAVEVFRRLAAEIPDVANYRQRLGWSLTSLANAKRDRANWAEAEGHYREALALQKTLAKENPRSTNDRDDQSDSHWGLANTLKRAGKLKDAEAEYRAALALKESLAAEFPAAISHRRDAANLARELGVFLSDNGQDEAGAKFFPRAIGTLDPLATEFPSIPAYRREITQARRDYGKVLGYLKRPVEGAEQFRLAVTAGERLVSDHPTVLSYQHELGLTYSYFGELRLNEAVPAESRDWYDKAIRTLTAVYERDRQRHLTKSALYKAHDARANALCQLGEFAEALSDRDKALELGPPEKRDAFRLRRADTRLRAGRVAEAVAEADELSRIEMTNSFEAFQFARFDAMASRAVTGRKDELTTRAMGHLKKAVSLGFTDAGRIRASEDLAPLREREDFRALLKDLDAKAPKPQAPSPESGPEECG